MKILLFIFLMLHCNPSRAKISNSRFRMFASETEKSFDTTDDGFFTETYSVEGFPFRMMVRQVPGDGNCLFHSISACLEYANTFNHTSLRLQNIFPKSLALRKIAVDYLMEDFERLLYLEGGETVSTKELLDVVSAQYNLTVIEYCTQMKEPSVWGGGPEIVALSNFYKRPIHVYELAQKGKKFCFRRMACFGSPAFEHISAPIHILSADARFPNLKPGEQLQNGNHFLCLFPCKNLSTKQRARKKQKLFNMRKWFIYYQRVHCCFSSMYAGSLNGVISKSPMFSKYFTKLDPCIKISPSFLPPL
mmetsp:Transcript_10948/g.16311  ORF Transcript_10948/g.16311 Transcript_10948/m.16311 type:complete len:305 (-) Transcript_10948:70-984(-)